MTKRIAIAELEYEALSFAVAKSVDQPILVEEGCVYVNDLHSSSHGDIYSPFEDWSQCGPLKARYKIDTIYLPDGSVRCRYPKKIGRFPCFDEELGNDELTAACRAIVSAHNPSGFVEVPDELVEGE